MCVCARATQSVVVVRGVVMVWCVCCCSRRLSRGVHENVILLLLPLLLRSDGEWRHDGRCVCVVFPFGQNPLRSAYSMFCNCKCAQPSCGYNSTGRNGRPQLRGIINALQECALNPHSDAQMSSPTSGGSCVDVEHQLLAILSSHTYTHRRCDGTMCVVQQSAPAQNKYDFISRTARVKT